MSFTVRCAPRGRRRDGLHREGLGCGVLSFPKLAMRFANALVPATLLLGDIQVLCPMNRGSLGAREMNLQLQNAPNPQRELSIRFDSREVIYRSSASAAARLCCGSHTWVGGGNRPQG